MKPTAELAAKCDQWPSIGTDQAEQRDDKLGIIAGIRKIVNSAPGYFAELAIVLLGIAMSHTYVIMIVY